MKNLSTSVRWCYFTCSGRAEGKAEQVMNPQQTESLPHRGSKSAAELRRRDRAVSGPKAAVQVLTAALTTEATLIVHSFTLRPLATAHRFIRPLIREHGTQNSQLRS
ncbi:hypothetical protein AOLI_G00272360 [Acnodon oligacanthus]